MKNQATTIANEIKAQMKYLQANNISYDVAELVYDYFAQLSEGFYPQKRTRDEVLDLLIK